MTDITTVPVDQLEKEIETLRNQIMPGASDTDLKLFSKYCVKTKLDPFSRQIYAINRGGKYTYQTSIDGFRLVAERSGKYEGQTPVYWCGMDGLWVDVWLKKEPPIASKVGVYKTGHREPTWAVAKFDSYAQSYGGKLSNLWKKMPDLMIAKCAESLALRKAFPNDLSGLYTTDEMGQAGNTNTPVASTEKPKELVIVPVTPFMTKDKIKELIALVIIAGLPSDSLQKFASSMNRHSIESINESEFENCKKRLTAKAEANKELKRQKPNGASDVSFKLETE